MNTTVLSLHDALQSSPLVRGLTNEQALVLEGLLVLLPVQAQQPLAQEGQVDNRLFVVVQGSLDVVKHLGTPDETVLVSLKAGDFAHELGFLDGAPRYASLRAGSAGQVLVLEREKLESLIDTHPRILYAVMCAIVRTVHGVQTRLSAQATELTNYIVKQHGRY